MNNATKRESGKSKQRRESKFLVFACRWHFSLFFSVVRTFSRSLDWIGISRDMFDIYLYKYSTMTVSEIYCDKFLWAVFNVCTRKRERAKKPQEIPIRTRKKKESINDERIFYLLFLFLSWNGAKWACVRFYFPYQGALNSNVLFPIPMHFTASSFSTFAKWAKKRRERKFTSWEKRAGKTETKWKYTLHTYIHTCIIWHSLESWKTTVANASIFTSQLLERKIYLLNEKYNAIQRHTCVTYSGLEQRHDVQVTHHYTKSTTPNAPNDIFKLLNSERKICRENVINRKALIDKCTYRKWISEMLLVCKNKDICIRMMLMCHWSYGCVRLFVTINWILTALVDEWENVRMERIQWKSKWNIYVHISLIRFPHLLSLFSSFAGAMSLVFLILALFRAVLFHYNFIVVAAVALTMGAYSCRCLCASLSLMT